MENSHLEKADIDAVEKAAGYSFTNQDLLRQAFARRQNARGGAREDNSVLALIGGSILDAFAVRILAERYGFYFSECKNYDAENDPNEFCSDKKENQFSQIKNSLLGKETLSAAADELGLGRYARAGGKGRKSSSPANDDLFRAVIGAIALDSGWNRETIESAADYMLRPQERLDKADDGIADVVGLVYGWSVKNCGMPPETEIEERKRVLGGLLSAGFRKKETRMKKNLAEVPADEAAQKEPLFRCTLRLDGTERTFTGTGRTKSEARKEACADAYTFLEDNGLLFSARSEIKDPNRNDAVNQLDALYRKGYFSEPEYSFSQSEKEEINGNPLWTACCRIADLDSSSEAKSATKKEAKREAAYLMLVSVLGMEKDL